MFASFVKRQKLDFQFPDINIRSCRKKVELYFIMVGILILFTPGRKVLGTKEWAQKQQEEVF